MIVSRKANEILDSLIPNSSQKGYTYIGLSTTTPTEPGTNFTEPSTANNYKRKQITVMGAASNGQISNADIIYFPLVKNASWGTISHFGLFNSETGGTPYFVGAVDTPVVLPTGYAPCFDTKSLIIGLDKESLDLS